ncbi:MAG TPA: GAF domain-containing protein [Candidatus Baltobacteraceae bacterium]|nr:GAF domain-containing protein [Candidatus Baltobacteraceae bacterium]
MSDDVVRQLGAILDTTEMRDVRAQHAAEAVRAARGYRWVGIYDVGDEEIELVGHSGVQAPARIRVPVEQGLSGDAVRTRETVNAGNETIVPILGAETGMVIGTLDVESDKPNAFDEADQRFLEACAQALMPLFD